jgi:hypothetical protein
MDSKAFDILFFLYRKGPAPAQIAATLPRLHKSRQAFYDGECSLTRRAPALPA